MCLALIERNFITLYQCLKKSSWLVSKKKLRKIETLNSRKTIITMK